MRIDNIPYRRDIFGRLVPATEAEDLTEVTDDMMKRAGTKQADKGNLSPEPPADNDADAGGDTGADIGTDGGDMGGDTGDLGEPPDAPDMGGEGGDDGMGGDDGTDMGEDEQDENLANESPETINSVTKLHKNMTAFYRAVTSAADTLGKFSVPASSDELRIIYSDALTHLNEMKEIIFDELSSDFTVKNYGVKLRKYVALRHVYSTVLEMISLHFDILDKENQRKNGQKSVDVNRS